MVLREGFQFIRAVTIGTIRHPLNIVRNIRRGNRDHGVANTAGVNGAAGMVSRERFDAGLTMTEQAIRYSFNRVWHRWGDDWCECWRSNLVAGRTISISAVLMVCGERLNGGLVVAREAVFKTGDCVRHLRRRNLFGRRRRWRTTSEELACRCADCNQSNQDNDTSKQRLGSTHKTLPFSNLSAWLSLSSGLVVFPVGAVQEEG
jgi:hypothetical protein